MKRSPIPLTGMAIVTVLLDHALTSGRGRILALGFAWSNGVEYLVPTMPKELGRCGGQVYPSYGALLALGDGFGISTAGRAWTGETLFSG